MKSRSRNGHEPSKTCKEESPLHLPSFWWFLANLDVPCLATKPPQSLSPSSHGVVLSSVCVLSLLIKTKIMVD